MTNETASAGAPALPIVPTAHDRSFVPYVVGTDPDFDKCLPGTELQEGPIKWISGPMPAQDYSNDPHDPGGMTGEGILQREYDLKRRQWGLPTQWVRNISHDEERTIYFTDYWMPYSPKLPIGLAKEFFDLDVNGGGHRAVAELQLTLGIPADGIWGPQTDAAVEALKAHGDIDKAIETYKAYREAFYRALSTFRYFGSDWIRRSEEEATEGLALQEAADRGGGPAV